MCLVFFAKYIKVSCGGNYTSNDPLNSASDFISERQEIITCTPRWCQLGKKRSVFIQVLSYCSGSLQINRIFLSLCLQLPFTPSSHHLTLSNPIDYTQLVRTGWGDQCHFHPYIWNSSRIHHPNNHLFIHPLCLYPPLHSPPAVAVAFILHGELLYVSGDFNRISMGSWVSVGGHSTHRKGRLRKSDHLQ